MKLCCLYGLLGMGWGTGQEEVLVGSQPLHRLVHRLVVHLKNELFLLWIYNLKLFWNNVFQGSFQSEGSPFVM